MTEKADKEKRDNKNEKKRNIIWNEKREKQEIERNKLLTLINNICFQNKLYLNLN